MKKYLLNTLAILLSAVSLISCSDKKVDEPQELSYDVLVDGLAYNIDPSVMSAYVVPKTNPSDYSGNITIPSTITVNGKELTVVEIQGSAFKDTKITSVTLPNTLKVIRAYSFSGCSNLTKIQLPSSLQTIGEGAFIDTSIESVTIPPSLTSLSYYSFGGDKLKEFIIEDSELTLNSLTSLYDTSLEYAYIGRNLTNGFGGNPDYTKTVVIGENVANLKSISDLNPQYTITCYAVKPPKVDISDVDLLMNGKLLVPAESLELYKADYFWGQFFNIEAIN